MSKITVIEKLDKIASLDWFLKFNSKDPLSSIRNYNRWIANESGTQLLYQPVGEGLTLSSEGHQVKTTKQGGWTFDSIKLREVHKRSLTFSKWAQQTTWNIKATKYWDSTKIEGLKTGSCIIMLVWSEANRQTNVIPLGCTEMISRALQPMQIDLYVENGVSEISQMQWP